MNCTSCGAELTEGMAFCPSCGSPRAEAETDPHATGVGAGRPPGAPPGSSGTTPPTSPPPTPPPDAAAGPPPVPPPGPGPAPSSRRPPVGVLVAVGAVAVVVLAVIGYALFSGLGSDGSGGADSPEEAVRQLAISVETGDPVGVLENLEPEEVGPIVDLLEVTTQRAEELDLFAEGDTMAGLEIRVEDLELSTEELTPGVVKVTIDDGSFDASVTQPDFGYVVAGRDEPLLDAGTTTEVDADLTSLYGEDDDGDELDTFVVAVERDGSWYVSPFYTLAEVLREVRGLDRPDFDSSSEPVGADSPTEAVEAFFDAGFDVDPEDTLSVVSPTEFAFAADYLGTLEDAFDEDLDALEDDDLELEELDLGDPSDAGDGVTLVPVDELRFSFDDDGDPVEITVESGPCVTREDEFDTDETCLRESLLENRDDPALADLVPEDLFVATVERDGSWYVSPMVTLAEYGKYAVERFDERHLGSLGVVEPKVLEVGETVEATVSTPYQPDVYEFETPDADAFVVEVSGQNADVYARIYPPGADDAEGLQYGGLLAYEDEVEGELIVGAESDTYVVEIEQDLPYSDFDDAAAADESGGGVEPDVRGLDQERLEYTVRVVPLDIGDRIPFAETVSDAIDEGEWALYEVQGGMNEEFSLEVDGPVEAVLIGDDGYTVAEEDFSGYGDGLPMYLLLRGVDDGDFSVTVVIAGPEIDFELPSGTTDPIPLVPGSGPVEGAVVDDTPVDYVLSGVEGPVTITVRRTSPDPLFVPWVTLIDFGGSDLADVPAGDDGVATLTTEAYIDEPWVVSVWRGYDQADGTFTIEVALG